MAQTIMCDMCKAEPAVMLQSNVATGETIAVGDVCMFPYFYTQAMELAPEDTFPTEPEPEPETPKPTRKRATRKTPDPQPEPGRLAGSDEAEAVEMAEANATDAPPF